MNNSYCLTVWLMFARSMIQCSRTHQVLLECFLGASRQTAKTFIVRIGFLYSALSVLGKCPPRDTPSTLGFPAPLSSLQHLSSWDVYSSALKARKTQRLLSEMFFSVGTDARGQVTSLSLAIKFLPLPFPDTGGTTIAWELMKTLLAGFARKNRPSFDFTV